MKYVERSEAPSSRPQKDVVSAAEKPYQWEVCKCHDTGPICRISQKLAGYIRPTYLFVSTAHFQTTDLWAWYVLDVARKRLVVHKTEDDAESPEAHNDERFNSG